MYSTLVSSKFFTQHADPWFNFRQTSYWQKICSVSIEGTNNILPMLDSILLVVLSLNHHSHMIWECGKPAPSKINESPSWGLRRCRWAVPYLEKRLTMLGLNFIWCLPNWVKFVPWVNLPEPPGLTSWFLSWLFVKGNILSWSLSAFNQMQTLFGYSDSHWVKCSNTIPRTA